MSNEFITGQVDKIFQNKEFPFPKNLAMACAWIVANFKGLNLKVINVQKRSSMADYFLLASTNNPTQSQSLSEAIIAQAKRLGNAPISVEGKDDAQWILIDLGDVIVHIFQDISREIYDLDTLWVDSPLEEIPNEYYYGSDHQTEEKSSPTDNYF
jgi:ribosome-associated protein